MGRQDMSAEKVPPQAIDIAPVVLAVGDGLADVSLDDDAMLPARPVAVAAYADVTPELIRSLRPEVVVSSVLGRSFDCVDLAEKLAAIGFAGCYRLIVRGMPRPDLVVNEVRALFPDLRIELGTATH